MHTLLVSKKEYLTAKIILAFILIGCLAGLLIYALFLVLFSLVLSKIPSVTQGTLRICSLIPILIGSFVSGFIAAWHVKRKGLFIGFCTGFVIFFIFVIIKRVIFNNFCLSASLVWLLLILVFSTVGGIVAVNRQ